MHFVERSYAAGSRMRTHAHATASMSIVLTGMFRESHRRRVEMALPFSVSFMGADIAHEDEFGPCGATLFQIHFDREFELLEERAAREALSGWTWVHTGPVVRQFVRLAHEARGADDELRSQCVIDVLAASANVSPLAGRAPPWLEQVREAIDDMHGWPRVADLAAMAGVHRVYLARQFRRFYRCSVSDYIRSRRVQQAARAIPARRASLSEVAHMADFHDHAHMCRAFRKFTSLTPSGYRALVRCRTSPAPLAS